MGVSEVPSIEDVWGESRRASRLCSESTTYGSPGLPGPTAGHLRTNGSEKLGREPIALQGVDQRHPTEADPETRDERSTYTPSIVVGIDGSKAAIRAALWAIDEAVSRDIPLRLLYAIEPDDVQPRRTGPPESSPSRRTQFVTRSQRSRLRTSRSRSKWRSPRSGPITSLIRASASADMVCVGAVGVHHFRPARVGSTAAALVGSGLCPVAIIRDQGHRDGPGWIVVDTGASAETTRCPDSDREAGCATHR